MLSKPYVSRGHLHRRLVDLVRAVHGACDNAIEDGEDGTSLDRRDYDAICQIINELDLFEYWLRQSDPNPNTNAIPREQGGDGMPGAKPGPHDWPQTA